MKLRLRIEVEYEDGYGQVFRLNLEDQEASVLLHLLSAMLYGDKEEIIGARIAWDLAQGKSYNRIAEELGVTKKTLWTWRRHFGFV